jgi:hypothetical protein
MEPMKLGDATLHGQLLSSTRLCSYPIQGTRAEPDVRNVFISHNKADKNAARALSEALLALGCRVWFDEWEICPGESFIDGMEEGLRDCDQLVLLWSKAAAQSNWVAKEFRSFVRRMVDDKELRLVPIMLDATALPTLVAEYRGFHVTSPSEIPSIAFELCGRPTDDKIIGMLHEILMSRLHGHKPLFEQPLAIFCQKCYSTRLQHGTSTDENRDTMYYWVECGSCGWTDATEV